MTYSVLLYLDTNERRIDSEFCKTRPTVNLLVKAYMLERSLRVIFILYVISGLEAQWWLALSANALWYKMLSNYIRKKENSAQLKVTMSWVKTPCKEKSSSISFSCLQRIFETTVKASRPNSPDMSHCSMPVVTNRDYSRIQEIIIVKYITILSLWYITVDGFSNSFQLKKQAYNGFASS